MVNPDGLTTSAFPSPVVTKGAASALAVQRIFRFRRSAKRFRSMSPLASFGASEGWFPLGKSCWASSGLLRSAE